MSSMSISTLVLVVMLGFMISLTSCSLVGLWLGLEVTSMMVVSFMNSAMINESESACKYYLVQSSSSLLIFSSGFIMSGIDSDSMLDFLCHLILLVGILYKVGLFPLHFWVVPVLSNTSILACFWLMGPQKVLSFWLISSMYSYYNKVSVFLMTSMVLTSAMGVFLGLGKTNVREILSCSSLIETGWMGMVSMVSMQHFIFYLTMYSICLSSVLALMKSSNYTKLALSAHFGLSQSESVKWVFLSLCMLSLSGVPPFMGFSAKLWASVNCIGVASPMLLALMGLSGLSSYMYINLFGMSLISLGMGNKGNMMFENVEMKKLSMLVILMNLGGGFMIYFIGFIL